MAKKSSAAKNLVIVESPAKARTISNFLGDEYTVIASVGHVRDLVSFGYGVDVKSGNFEPNYTVDKDKIEIVTEIKDAAKEAETVFLSTDPDREGEAISWHIVDAAEIPQEKTKRVVFHEITQPAIEEAFAHPGDINRNLVEAQETRRVIDRLIGYPLSWLVQEKILRSGSAGRVQSVALRLIVEREREITGFEAQEYWSIHGLFTTVNGESFTAKLHALPGKKRLDKNTIPNEDKAQELIEIFKNSQFEVATVTEGNRKRKPPPPFTTSSFQQAANNRYGMNAANAMRVAQSLYEGVDIPGQGQVGLITYMRTDSTNVSSAACKTARENVTTTWGKDFIPTKPRTYSRKSKGAQEAHEAIRPTNPLLTPESLTSILNPNELRIYTLIWQRFLASQMSEAQYGTMRVDINAVDGTESKGTFRVSSSKLTFPGYLAIYDAKVGDTDEREKDDNEKDDDATPQVALPNLKQGNQVNASSVDGKQHFTEPPPRYTDASLVKKLEEEGIGRPSTYAATIQTVLNRDYAERQARSLVPTENGFIVNDFLVEYMNRYVAIPFTSELEGRLDGIANGEHQYSDVVRSVWEPFFDDYNSAKENAPKQQKITDIPCEECENGLYVVRRSRHGEFLGCSNYPECKSLRPLTEEGEPATPEEPEASHYICPRCAKGTIIKTGPYGQYLECDGRAAKDCDFRTGIPEDISCPECDEEDKNGQLVERSSRRGTFYACWNYPDCTYNTNSIEPANIKEARPPEEREAARKKAIERTKKRPKRRTRRRS